MQYTAWLRSAIGASVILIGTSTAVALTVRIDGPSPNLPEDIYYTVGSQGPLEFTIQLFNESTEATDPIVSWQLALGISADEGSAGNLLFDSFSVPEGSLFGEESDPQLLSQQLPANELVVTDIDLPGFEGVIMAPGSTAPILTVRTSASANALGTFTLAMRPYDEEDTDHSSFWLLPEDVPPKPFFNQSAEPPSHVLAAIHISSDNDFAGDFNHDLIIDAADYTVWRNGLGSLFDPDEYQDWKEHFGENYQSGRSAGEVPEPTAVCLELIGVSLAAIGRFRRH